MSVAYVCSTNPYNYVLYLRSTLYCAESLVVEILQLFTAAYVVIRGGRYTGTYVVVSRY